MEVAACSNSNFSTHSSTMRTTTQKKKAVNQKKGGKGKASGPAGHAVAADGISSDGHGTASDGGVLDAPTTPRLARARATVDHLARLLQAGAASGSASQLESSAESKSAPGHAAVYNGILVSCYRVDTMGGELFNWVCNH